MRQKPAGRPSSSEHIVQDIKRNTRNAVLQGLMPTFDLALRLRMIRRAANMVHLIVSEPLSEVTRDITRGLTIGPVL